MVGGEALRHGMTYPPQIPDVGRHSQRASPPSLFDVVTFFYCLLSPSLLSLYLVRLIRG